MKLSSLLQNEIFNSINLINQKDPEITSIHFSSKDVKPGGIFVAIKGFKTDGHSYIDDAISNGAAAVITEETFKKNTNNNFINIKVKDTRLALSAISANFYDNPSEKMFIIGITGTNGKTTTSYIIENILKTAGFKTGLIGTINYRYAGKEFPNPMTSPESLDLHKIMSQMYLNGITHVIMEVSSHALDLKRVAHCKFNAGIFTNLTQDHLDYHKDLESYWLCKEKLFTKLLNNKNNTLPNAIINCDDKKGLYLKDKLLKNRQNSLDIISTGCCLNSDIKPENITFGINGMKGKVKTPKGDLLLDSEFIGNFNLENMLSSIGLSISIGLDINTIEKGIKYMPPVPGRLEKIPNKKNRFVFVDYAHTPDALSNVLKALKSLVNKRLICIFGCGGDRDKTKRSIMGKIAAKYSDIAIVTSDNPRSENPDEIIKQIISEDAVQKRYIVEPDRKKAIEIGITTSKPYDTVLIAGKGHETYQIIGTKRLNFDDRLEAKKALENL